MRTPSLLATLSALALVPALAQAAPAKAALKAPKTTTKAPGKELAKDGAKAAQLPAPVKVTAVEGITEYKLGNGLRVLLYPDASKPQMTVNITYLVGSKQESYGETGMAHLLEHLLFKGTDAHPDVPKVLNGLGARFNGSTWFDRTNYYVGFPASDANLSIALDLEADRMVNSHIWKKDLWDEKEQKGEMTVVRNEMEAGENDPSGVLTDRVASVAFDWHNYGKSTIGARSDVENVNTDHLKDFYRKFYQPDNAVLLVAGKIDEAKVLAEVNEKFGRIPRPTRVLEKLWTVEPTQDGERSVTVRRVGGTPVLVAGYHVPQTANQDASAVSLIQGILTEEPSGRLYKALVETKLATHAEGFAVSTLDPTFEMFSIELPKDGNVAEAKRIALETIEGFKAKPITNEELERAKARASKLSDLVLQRTDILAIQLSEAIAAGDWRVWFLKRDQTEKLTLAQVQAAAERYFKQSNRTLGEYVPTEKPDRSEMPAAMDLAAELKDYKGRAVVAEGEVFDPSPKNIDARTERFAAANGMKVALLPKSTKGHSVSVSMTLRFGTEKSLMDAGAAPTLAAQLLTHGSKGHTREQLQDELDKMKAVLQVGGGSDTARATVLTNREHLGQVLKLLAEVLRTPTYPESELNIARNEALTAIDQEKSEPQSLAVNAFQVATSPYPKGHPKAARSFEEQAAQLKAVKVEELRAFHDAFYGADHATVAVVGDFDAKETHAALEQLFGDWKSPQAYERIPTLRKEPSGQEESIETPDKANAMFVAGLTNTLRDDDADFAAFQMANQMLGGGALKSRLADRIRQKEGLSYGVGSQFQADAFDHVGQWIAFAIYAPENVGKLVAAFREELKKAGDEGFREDELTFSKGAWQKGREVNRTQDTYLAQHWADLLFQGRTFAFDEAHEAKIAALPLADVNAAYKKYLDQSKITIVKAGDFAKAQKAKAAGAAGAPSGPAAK